MTSTWLVGCGRVGFGDLDRDPPGNLSDAPGPADAAEPSDAAPIIDALDPLDARAPTDSRVALGPKLSASTVASMTTTCGGTPTSESFDVTNGGDAELVITEMKLRGESFQLTRAGNTVTLPIRIAAGATVRFDVQAPTAVIGTDVGGRTKTASFTITSNAVDNPTVVVPVTATVVGANIAVTVPASSQPLAFSDTSGNCPLPRPATIQNTGTSAAVQILRPAAFAMTGNSTANIATNATVTRTFRPFTSAACSGAAVIEYQVIGPNCGASGATALTATFNITGTSTCFCS